MSEDVARLWPEKPLVPLSAPRRALGLSRVYKDVDKVQFISGGELPRFQTLRLTCLSCSQECVRACARTGDTQLLGAVLRDELVAELLEHLPPGGAGGELSRSAARVAARARVLAAVSIL